jgi:transposase
VPRLSAGQRHESTEAVPLLEETLERLWTDAVAGDKAYGTSDIRNWLTAHEIDAVIPWKANETGPKAYDRDAYRERPIVERTINRLKRYRRIATRYEKRAAAYLSMVTIACILEWL